MLTTHVHGEAHIVGPVYPSPPHFSQRCATGPPTTADVVVGITAVVDRVVVGIGLGLELLVVVGLTLEVVDRVVG